MNPALGELETKQTSVQLPTSHGDGGGASFVLQALDEDMLGGLLEGEVGEEPPGGGSGETAGENEETNTIEKTGAAKNVAKWTDPLSHDVLDTISHLDIEIRNINMNITSNSSYVH